MGTVFINEFEVEANPRENLVQAAARVGVEIPHYCWHHDLSVVASCRMCLVEVGDKQSDGTVTMGPRLVPACQTLARPNTVVKCATEKVKAAQAQTLEYLLLNHPLDCSICDQAGECYLQDYSYKFGKAHSRLHEPKVQRLDKYHIGEQIALFTDRCVMCTRCVRFTREVSGTSELHVIGRGSTEEIEVFPDNPCNNKLAGNVVDLCPVGALCSKDFLYKKRVWWLKSQDSVCQGCSTGCSINVDQSENSVYRIRPRENPKSQGSFMCDDGRFGWKYISDEQRLLAPRIGRHAPSLTNGNGKASHSPLTVLATAKQRMLSLDAVNDLSSVDPWPDVLDATRRAIRQVIQGRAEQLAVVLSPMMFCEEAYLLAKWVKSLDRKVMLAMGPIPMVGEDDLYPKGPKGEPPASNKIKFTIRAEKCPNRMGVELLLKHFQGEVIPFENVAEKLKSRQLAALYLVGGYPQEWMHESLLQQLAEIPTLIVQDILKSKLSDVATILLASGTFVERDGSVVNYAGLAQGVNAAVRPLADARPDGRLLHELVERSGLYNAVTIRKEMAREIPAFVSFNCGDVGRLGTLLQQPVAEEA